MSDNLYWLWLSLNCDSALSNRLLDDFGTPYALYSAKEEEVFATFKGKSIPLSVKELMKKDLSQARKTMNYCFMRRIGILSMDDPAYPASLRQIENPPPVLYYRGKLIKMDKHFSVAVVGTRSMSRYGERVTFSIAHDLARTGAIIVSGLARGVDGVASAAAVAAGEKTVAVLGSGLDRIYPPEHRTLASAVMRNGMLLSEYPPFSPPHRHHFPERNRIISALSAGALVVEGREGSGALITARIAKATGKPLFAVPGNVDAPNSFAPNHLIHEGATAVRSADDIFSAFPKSQLRQISIENLLKPTRVSMDSVLTSLSVSSDPAPGEAPVRRRRDPLAFRPRTVETAEELPLADTLPTAPPIREEKPRSPRSAATATPSEPLSEEEAAVLHAMPPDTPIAPDAIAAKTSLGVGKIMAILLMLEIKGRAQSLPGGRFLRI